MKKLLFGSLIFILTICSVVFLSGCTIGGKKAEAKYKVVVTIFPEYDWVKNVIGDSDEFELTLLLDTGVDLHSYQPTVKDIAKISTCDLFIYVGGESDEWVEDALANAKNDKLIALNLLEILGEKAKLEELVEGMEGEEHDHEDEEEEEEEYDEHVWLSLRNAQLFVNEICKSISTIDDANKNEYQANAASYCSQLDALDKKCQNAMQSVNKQYVVFGDRFPFRYFVDDYNLNYYAAFVGCSAESEASFQTIIFLAQKVDELGLNAIIKIESSNGEIAQTIKNNTTNKNQKIITVDSLQSATLKNYEAGKTYLKIMDANIDAFIEALM